MKPITYTEDGTISFPDGLVITVPGKDITRTIQVWLEVNGYQSVSYGYRSRLGGKAAPLVVKIDGNDGLSINQEGIKDTMRKALEALITKMEALKEKAEEMCDSENDKTAERYETITSCIEAALESIQEAVDEFDS